MSDSKRVLFYASYRDKNGFEHHTVNAYDRLSGLVLMMRDLIFDDIAAVPSYEEDSKRFQVTEDSCNQVFLVWDTVKDCSVATFYDKNAADEWCELKNLDEKYLDDLEDDPWA